MRVHFIDYWDIEAPFKLVPSNGFVKKCGDNVMGAGIASMVKTRYPDSPRLLGEALAECGNCVMPFMTRDNTTFLSFPTKEVWWNKSELSIIERSCMELIEFIEEPHDNIEVADKTIVLPRPGCGNGGLRWADVEPVLDTYLSGYPQVIVIDRPQRR